jgi:hypothetical protein
MARHRPLGSAGEYDGDIGVAASGLVADLY